MNWYETLLITPVSALNNIRSNVWSVILIIVGISLVIHGHADIGSSLITGAFAVFRSSDTNTAPVPYNSIPTATVQVNSQEPIKINAPKQEPSKTTT